MIHIKKFILLLILLLAVITRFYGINWDRGFNLHPDERAIILFTLPLELPNSLEHFFSPQSPLNPHFFAYGSFPMYLLKASSYVASQFNPLYANYDNIALVGRTISILFELITILLIVRLGKKVFNETVGIIGAFLYAFSTLAIQLSHFYTVDTPLTTIVVATLLLTVSLYKNPKTSTALLIGIFIGLGLAIKNSALVLLSSVSVALAINFLFIFLAKPHKYTHWTPHLIPLFKNVFLYGIVILLIIPLSFFIFEPYAFISFPEFWHQTLQQYEMTHNAFTFPYTLQYVGKIPYIYELKNIFFWGQGPFIAVVTLTGTLFVTYRAFFKKSDNKYPEELIILTFLWVYFGIIGNFSIGFMRYSLPLYPIICLCGGVLIYTLCSSYKKYSSFLLGIIIIGVLVWPLSFLHIYSYPNTRVQASEWIHNNIPAGSTLALEHWDDGLPLTNQQKYRVEMLELYNPDTASKWEIINKQLENSEYIILASHRLYVPLQKLTDCQTLPQHACYPVTSNYYKNLFDGTLGFKKIAEFSTAPKIPFTSLLINDISSDESFTVYDHPKIMIYKK